MGYDCENEQPLQILFQIFRIMIALGNHKPHGGSRQAANQVNAQKPPGLVIVARPQGPGQMVKSHGQDGKYFQLISGKAGKILSFRLHSLPHSKVTRMWRAVIHHTISFLRIFVFHNFATVIFNRSSRSPCK